MLGLFCYFIYSFIILFINLFMYPKIGDAEGLGGINMHICIWNVYVTGM
jgi:hypothetical protein